MPNRVNRVVAVLLSLLLALGVATPAVSADNAPDGASPCTDCCDASPAGGHCVTVSVCAPASLAASAAKDTAAKPMGAWSAGVVRAPCIAPLGTPWAMAPASDSLGPPSYLRHQRFLL